MPDSPRQHTLKTSVTISGIGVHSGAPANMTLSPAVANSGITFVRTDIRDRNNVIPALWHHVTDTRLCTVLTNKAGVSVSTVEHILSACAALGLDNAVIGIDGPEVPIMDGSARDFMAALSRAGLQQQSAPRRVLRIKKTVTYQEGDKEAILSPHNGRCYSFEIAFDNALVGRQKYSHHFRAETYLRDIAPARTFGFLHEVEMLRKAGLARGGSLDNAVVVDGDRVLNPEGLRFGNEFVRHKILDAIGDLYLAGFQIQGHYHGVKAGHAMNNKVLHALFARSDAYDIVELGAEARTLVPVGRFTGLPAAATA